MDRYSDKNTSVVPGKILLWVLGITVILSSIQALVNYAEVLYVGSLIAGILILPPVLRFIRTSPRWLEYMLALLYAAFIVLVIISLFQHQAQ